jgi:hypothetical protein
MDVIQERTEYKHLAHPVVQPSPAQFICSAPMVHFLRSFLSVRLALMTKLVAMR